jgi:fido (protein-threonine AMPylation protein)
MMMTVKGRATRPDERQCAMLIAHLLATKQQEMEKGREITRARLSEITLQRLFKRRRISPEFLAEVQEWLFRIGWVLFFAGATYAVVTMKVVDGWGRISSKRIGDDLEKVGAGEFDFGSLEHLLVESDASSDAED